MFKFNVILIRNESDFFPHTSICELPVFCLLMAGGGEEKWQEDVPPFLFLKILTFPLIDALHTPSQLLAGL